MSRTFDTREAWAAQRLDCWTQTVCDQIVPVQIDPRGDREIRAGDPGMLQVGMQLTGSSLLVQDGREAVMGAGDIVLYDSSRPFSLVMDARFHWQVFLLPKEKLRRSDREIDSPTAVRTGCAAVDTGAAVVLEVTD